MVDTKSGNPTVGRSAVEWVLVCLIGGNLAWTTLCLGGYRPETMLVTGLLTALILIVYWADCVVRGRTAMTHWVGWVFVPFLSYAAANVWWVTPVQWLGWQDWYGWANTFVIFVVVLNGVRDRKPQSVLLCGLGVLVIAATLMACYQRFVQPEWLMLGRTQAGQFVTRSSGPFGIPNSLAAFYLLVLPVLLGLTLRRRASVLQRVLFGYVTLCGLCGLYFTVSRGGWLAFLLALSSWPLLAGRWTWRSRVAVALVLATLLGLTGWGLRIVSPEVKTRFNAGFARSGEWTRPIMWRGAWALFKSAPVTGTGAGSYNVLFERHRPENYQMEPRWAHNEYLNTLSDYGFVGFGLLFGSGAIIAVYGLARKVSVNPERSGSMHPLDEAWLRGALGIGLLAFMIQLAVDFHFKIPALGMLFSICAALLVGRVWPMAPSYWRTGNRWLGMAGLVGVGLITGLGMYPHYRAEALRYSARQGMDQLWQYEPTAAIYQETLQLARTAVAHATAIDPSNAQAWADRALADALWSHLKPEDTIALGKQAEVAADQALALSQMVPEFWIRRAVAKDMQRKWVEAGEDMVQALNLAPARAQTWFYQAYHLSLQPATKALALAAFDYCLLLDPAHVTAQRLRQKLATSQ